ncbi:replication initiation protein [Azospirillum canadense]|uniref:replication protein RepA n=1 Tax=Azospirillum canadense TaxID=403962 RepID=UPI0022266AD8|nr:replication protein RepA [Azospirillum canadense]MCW2240666.1 hypothetical protein [Azospirillum canadense]
MRQTQQYALQLGLPFDVFPMSSAPPCPLPPAAPAPASIVPPSAAAPADAYDFMFNHVSFCHSAFPQGKPGDEFRQINRRNGKFAMTITPVSIALPGEDNAIVRFGVPYGAKPRLLTAWVVTQLLDPARGGDDNLLELGPIRDFFTALGTSWSGQALQRTKDQLLRLAYTRMTMVNEGATADAVMDVSLFDATLLPPGTLRAYRDGRFADIQWPQVLGVNAKMAATFRRHAVPIPTQRLSKVAENPMATDLFLYMCYRLPFLKDDEHLPIKVLARRFGDGIAPSKFRAKFMASLRAARDAYPEADIEVTDEGLTLRRSDPAALRQAFVQVPPSMDITAAPKQRRRSVRRFLNAPQVGALPSASPFPAALAAAVAGPTHPGHQPMP